MSVKNETTSFLTFKLDEEVFGINVQQVLEIVEVTPITKVPGSLKCMRGVINLRGSILPVIDTRAKFKMTDTSFTVDTCIIVLSINSNNETLLVGALVDAVQKVIELPQENIQPSNSMGVLYEEKFITGMGKTDHGFIMILDVEKVFSVQDAYVLPAAI
jgi:purine-binding chemotaxis protein CheW